VADFDIDAWASDASEAVADAPKMTFGNVVIDPPETYNYGQDSSRFGAREVYIDRKFAGNVFLTQDGKTWRAMSPDTKKRKDGFVSPEAAARWLDRFKGEAVDEASRISITRGMANAMGRGGGTIARRCEGCGLGIPRYRGRYPSVCPSCGGDLVEADDPVKESVGPLREGVETADAMVAYIKSKITHLHDYKFNVYSGSVVGLTSVSVDFFQCPPNASDLDTWNAKAFIKITINEGKGLPSWKVGAPTPAKVSTAVARVRGAFQFRNKTGEPQKVADYVIEWFKKNVPFKTESIDPSPFYPRGFAINEKWLGERTLYLPANAASFLRQVAIKKVHDLISPSLVFVSDDGHAMGYVAKFALAGGHEPRIEFAVFPDDIDDGDGPTDGTALGWVAEIRDVYGKSPVPGVARRRFYEGIGGTVNDAVKNLKRVWQGTRTLESVVAESPVATSTHDVVQARTRIMSDASKALGTRIASLEVKHRFNSFFLLVRDGSGHYWTSMEDDAPTTIDPDEWLVSVADGRTVKWADAKSWVRESSGPVVAVSLVPRLQKIIEAGTHLTDESVDDARSVRRLVPFDVVEKELPGGVAGLEMFLEGPVGESTYFRLEGPMDPVLIFEVNHAAKAVTVYATESPASILGSDPRDQLDSTNVHEADDYDAMVMGESLDEVYETPTRDDLADAYGRTPTPGYILNPTRPSGATRAHGPVRFRIGANKTRKPRYDLAQAIQNRRNAKRGLASRIAAAKKWHRGVAGQELHKSLGRYNTGNHRGEGAEEIRQDAAIQAANESVSGLVPSAVALEIDLPPSLGYPREEMPQIEDTYAFLEYLRSMGAVVSKEQVPVKNLHGSQDVDPEKVKAMAALDVDTLRAPIISSKDDFILDGHHRWAALYYLGPLNQIETYRVMLSFTDLLKLAREWSGATYKVVGEAVDEGVHRPEDRIRAVGGKWAARDFGDSHEMPVLFATRREALDAAARQEVMARERGVTDHDEQAIKDALAPKTPAKTPLSKIVRSSNKKNAPPGGWTSADRVTEANASILPGVPERSVDDIFDALMRRLVVIESTDVLEDVEFTDKGGIYLFFDPSLSPAEVDEVMRALQSEEPGMVLIASPDKSLPGETATSDWWVTYLPGKTQEGQEPIDPNMYAREPGQAGAPKQQMVVQAQTTLDAIAASVDTAKLVQAAASKSKGDENTETKV
jgi:hypothetical protein